MITSWQETGLHRRGFISLAAGLTALAASSTGDAAAAKTGIDLTDPETHLNLFRKMSASTQDGEEVLIHYQGTVFGMVEDTVAVPLYGLQGLSPCRTFRLPDGTIRFLACEIGLFTDLATGQVIDSWRNPFTEETVEVFHLRNGPINYALTPQSPVDTNGWKLLTKPHDRPASGFYIPATIEGEELFLALDAQARRKNPLDPAKWKRESSGAEVIYSEHNTWRARLADLTNPRITAAHIFAAWHSMKPWRHWMLMGQRPGRIYNHLRARKIPSLDQAPANIRAHAEKHFPEFLKAPPVWTGAYQDDWKHFINLRTPL